MEFNEHTLTDAVIARMAGAQDERFRVVMSSLVRHLHDFVRDVELTEAEWFKAIAFLTATGQKCDDRRQEFILLSDTLGVSMLVDAIAHRVQAGVTESTVLGPFYVAGVSEQPMWADLRAGAPGTPCYLSGTVRGADGAPVAGAVVDVWQSDGVEGLYDVQTEGQPYCRGKLRTDAQGRFAFLTVQPVSYPVPVDGPVGDMLLAMGRHPYRPAHVHTLVSAEGFATLTTHIFVKGDRYLDSDAVFGVKDSLVAEFVLHPPGATPDGGRSETEFATAHYDFVLQPA